jgi:molybdopterin-biosynthesis enzyme MoeA-like protein
MTFGAFIIGDEIIRGKRPDKHFAQVIHILGTRGLILDWCEYVGDNPRRITQALSRTLASDDIVFSFGGIGATPDDHTRQCAAAAAGVPLIRHPEAAAEIEARFGDAAYPKRILMADLPQGSRIIPNPYNRIPGFSIKDHHFLPGFPEMAWPMMEWVLETFYKHLFPAVREIEQSILVFDVGESLLIDLMKENIAQFPQLKLFCLPSMPDQSGRRLELGVRGDAILVRAAIDHLKKGVDVLGYRWSEVL